MNRNSAAAKLSVFAVAIVAGLTSCGQQTKWTSTYSEGQRLLKAKDYDGAEKKMQAAIADAEEHNVPDKAYAGASAELGRLLYGRKKYAEAVPYLVQALQQGVANNMTLEENVELLHELARAEARSGDIAEAKGTIKALILLLETEKSPLTPELVEERRFHGELLAKATPKSKNSKDEHCVSCATNQMIE